MTIRWSVWKIVFVKKYPTDLTDSQWNHIKDLFPIPKAIGRPNEVEFREVVNAISCSLQAVMGRKRHIWVDTSGIDSHFKGHDGLCPRLRWIEKTASDIWSAS